MAKERKSKVTRLLPDVEETNKAVEELTKNDHKTKTTKADQEPESDKKKKKGRPAATHGKIRFTTLIDPALRDKMNIIRGLTGMEVNHMYNEAVKKYIDLYQINNPTPNLNTLLKQRKDHVD